MSVTSGLQRDAGRLHAGIGVFVVCLTLLLVAERFGPLLVNGASVPALGVAVVLAVPPAIYLAALWGVRPAFAAMRDGTLFAPAISAALVRVGMLLSVGAVLDVAVKPGVLALLGAGPGYLIALDFASYAIGTLGLALMLLARLVTRAADNEAELGDMF